MRESPRRDKAAQATGHAAARRCGKGRTRPRTYRERERSGRLQVRIDDSEAVKRTRDWNWVGYRGGVGRGSSVTAKGSREGRPLYLCGGRCGRAEWECGSSNFFFWLCGRMCRGHPPMPLLRVDSESQQPRWTAGISQAAGCLEAIMSRKYGAGGLNLVIRTVVEKMMFLKN